MHLELKMVAALFASSCALAQVPGVELFGTGCGGQAGQTSQPATLALSPAMRPGYPSTLQVMNLPPQSVGLLMIGSSRTQWLSATLPLGLGGLGMTGCQLLVAPELTLVFPTDTGSPLCSFGVPLDPALAAHDVFFQVMFHQPGLNPSNTGFSRGLRGWVAPLPAATAMRTSITQFGITFQFAAPVPAGQFVNGDWFVIGPATLVGMQPPCTVFGGRVMHGAMINANPSVRDHGYDKALYGPGNEGLYHDSLNVALGLSPSAPRVLLPNQSLIKVISNTNTALVPQIETCAVLTCLLEVPPAGSFRPPYAGPDHSVRYDEQMLDWTVLQALVPATLAPNIATQAALFERPWLDHAPGWPSRYLHPALNMPDYGRDFASLYNEAALLCNTNATQAQRRLLLMRLVQIGIDFWGNVKHGCYWEGVGGHGSGRKLPILFAGALLHDAEMLAVGQNYPSVRQLNGTYTTHFGEDCQTFYVQQTSVTQINWGYGGYTTADLGVPEFGFSHVHWPNSDHQPWTFDSYRRCCTANAWIGGVLCARIMGLRDEWHHPALFDYMDRYVQMETSGWTKAWSAWSGRMWDLYRPVY